jgi:hypothetical protein
MVKHTAAPHHEILEAALAGFEAQRQKLDEQIAQVRSMLGGRAGKVAKAPTWASEATGSNGSAPKKRILSPEARQRIAAAQKKRWAAYRRNKG